MYSGVTSSAACFCARRLPTIAAVIKNVLTTAYVYMTSERRLNTSHALWAVIYHDAGHFLEAVRVSQVISSGRTHRSRVSVNSFGRYGAHDDGQRKEPAPRNSQREIHRCPMFGPQFRNALITCGATSQLLVSICGVAEFCGRSFISLRTVRLMPLEARFR